MDLVAQIAERLLARGESLAVAESCTGGLVATWLTDLPGSSRWFERGLVTYSNRAKTELLDVPAALLERDGAVSERCVLAMADGLLRASPADWSISITGIAGPDGGTREKPVGTVWMAWMRRGGAASAQRFGFSGDRQAVRRQSAEAALAGLLERLDDAA